MVNKVFATPSEAIFDIADGAVIAIGGFSLTAGIPFNLIDTLIEKRVGNLTVLCNNFRQVNDLVREKRVKKVITCFENRVTYEPHIGSLEDAHRRGEVELEMVTHGILAERIQAWALGHAGFYTCVGVGTLIAKGKEKRIFNGQEYIFEQALGADFALIKADKSDTLGNLVYYRTMRNINPTMAQGASIVIAEVDEVVEAGQLDPEVIVTPGVFVDRVVKVKRQLRLK